MTKPNPKPNLSAKELTPEEQAVERLAKSEGISRAAAASRLAHEKLPAAVRNPPRPAASDQEPVAKDAEAAPAGS